MNRITSIVFAGIAGLILVSTVAEAADGCGRGMYYNGPRCVPQDDDGYGYVTTDHPLAGCGLISAAAATRRDTPPWDVISRL
jgi:hypothetical protein